MAEDEVRKVSHHLESDFRRKTLEAISKAKDGDEVWDLWKKCESCRYAREYTRRRVKKAADRRMRSLLKELL